MLMGSISIPPLTDKAGFSSFQPSSLAISLLSTNKYVNIAQWGSNKRTKIMTSTAALHKNLQRNFADVHKQRESKYISVKQLPIAVKSQSSVRRILKATSVWWKTWWMGLIEKLPPKAIRNETFQIKLKLHMCVNSDLWTYDSGLVHTWMHIF